MNMLKLAVIPGDGTGPEVTAEALKILNAVAPLENFKYETTNFDWGCERYLRTGETLAQRGRRRTAKIQRRVSRRRGTSRRGPRRHRKGPAVGPAI